MKKSIMIFCVALLALFMPTMSANAKEMKSEKALQTTTEHRYTVTRSRGLRRLRRRIRRHGRRKMRRARRCHYHYTRRYGRVRHCGRHRHFRRRYRHRRHYR